MPRDDFVRGHQYDLAKSLICANLGFSFDRNLAMSKLSKKFNVLGTCVAISLAGSAAGQLPPHASDYNRLRSSEVELLSRTSRACATRLIYASPVSASNADRFFQFAGDINYTGATCESSEIFLANKRSWIVQRIVGMKVPCMQLPNRGDCTVDVDRVCAKSLRDRPPTNVKVYYGPCQKASKVGPGGCAICRLREKQIYAGN